MIQTVLQLVAVAIAAAAAVAAFCSARAARRAADGAHKALQANIVSSLLDAYAQPEMLRAINAVRSWTSRDSIRIDSDIDHARRRLAHHFQKIAHLARAQLLDENLLRIVATREQVALYCQHLEPMEAQVNPDYDLSSFDALADLYGGRQYLTHVPLRNDV